VGEVVIKQKSEVRGQKSDVSGGLIIVTGACGFLGRHVVRLLAGDGRAVIAVDRVAPVDSLPDGVRFHLSPLEDPKTLLPDDVDDRADIILIHLAWNMARGADFAPQSDQISLLAGLLDYWKDKGVRKVIAMGSAEEYGRRSGKIHEYDPPMEPLSPYGWAKRSAWMMASSWSRRNNIPLIWLRPFIIYGSGQRGDMMLPYAISQAKAGKKAEFTDGLQERDFVHVTDVARAIQLAVSASITGPHALNIGTGNPVKVRDVIMAIARQYKAEHLFHLGARPRRPGEPERQVADIALARELLQWMPLVQWEA